MNGQDPWEISIMSKGKISELKAIINLPSDESHQEDFEAILNSEIDDRGFCILLATTLENLLDDALTYKLPTMTNDLGQQMFGNEGPASTFSRKITLARALGILGQTTWRNFTYIRHIRNAFAHAKRPIKFQTPEVEALTWLLTAIHPFEPEKLLERSETAREHFQSVVASMTVLLSTYAGFKTEPAQGIRTTHTAGMPLP